MRPRALATLVSTLLLCALPLTTGWATSARASTVARETALVVRAVDGDTLAVRIGLRNEKVRLIGVDTPETVDPRRPVQYFGKEASAFTKRLVAGRSVVLTSEAGKENRDRYGRLLRYVYLEDGRLLNAEIIKQGYGHAYVKYPFSRMEEFRAYERQARAKRLGLWGARADAGAAADTGAAATPGAATGPH